MIAFFIPALFVLVGCRQSPDNSEKSVAKSSDITSLARLSSGAPTRSTTVIKTPSSPRPATILPVAPVSHLSTSPATGPAAWTSALSGPGVSVHSLTTDETEIEAIQAAGFKWVRTDVGWSWTETQIGVYDFSQYDILVELLHKHGMNGYFTLDYSNPLYSNLSPTKDRKTRSAFAHWAAAFIQHFDGQGIIWEVLNEPDVAQFWPYGNDPVLYVELLKEIYALLPEGVQPILVGPASSTFGLFFTQDAIQAGLLDYVSAVSIHPYRLPMIQTPESTTDFGTVRNLISQFGPTGRVIPVLAGEVGFSSYFAWMDETWEAQNLAREFLSNASQGIPITVWYSWIDDPITGSFINIEQDFGLLTGSGVEKKAYYAAVQVNHFLNDFDYVGKASLSAGDYCLEFQNGNSVEFAAWTSNALQSLFEWLLPKLEVPVPAGNWDIIGTEGDAEGSQDLKRSGMKLGLTNSPLYIVPAP